MTAPALLDLGEAVTLRAVLIALGQLLLWVGALILAGLALAIVSSILWPLNKFVSTVSFGTVGSVPGSHAVEVFFSGLLGEAAAGVDSAAGSFWHGLKKLVVQVSTEILGLAILVGYLVWYATVKYPLRLLHTIVHQALHIAVRVETQIRHAERDAVRTYKYARAQVRRLEGQIKVAEHAIDVTLPNDIKTARDIANDALDQASNAWDWIKKNGGVITTGGLAGILPAVLSSIGLGWLFCKQNPISSAERPCSAWQDLADLLGLALTLEAALDFEQLVHTAQDAAEVTTTAIQDVFGLGG